MKKHIELMPGAGDPLVDAAIAEAMRNKTPMEQALCRKKMAEWLVAQAGVDKGEADVLVAKWWERVQTNYPDTKWCKFKTMLMVKRRMAGWWMRGLARLIFWSPLIAWRFAKFCGRKVVGG